MSKRISFGLSVSEVNDAIKQVKEYKKEINNKCRILCSRLLDAGYGEASVKIAESPLGKTIILNTSLSSDKFGCKAILFATGQKKTNDYGTIDTLMLVEFGAGIHFNPIPNPIANDFGMGVGTFPGQVHAFDDKGWYYLGDDGSWHHSYGVRATMPMYEASKAIKIELLAMARDIFA